MPVNTTRSAANWANRTKEALKDVTPVTATAGEDGLVAVGNSFAPITAYYSFNAPKKEGKTKVVVLEEGAEFNGKYDGSFKDKTYGKYTHKIDTNAGLIGLPGCGQLDKLMEKVAPGATVKIVYRGKQEIQSGKYAGSSAHAFAVRASKLVE